MEIILSTRNKGKSLELREALLPLDNIFGSTIKWLDMSSLQINSPEENQETFIENALLKARHCARCSGLPALADDSGLCVPSLNGEPGIYSARYAGEQANDIENYEKLLDKLQGITTRTAYFYCAIAYVNNPTDPTPIIAEGRWYGEILHKPQGSGGFGYDPIFQGMGLSASAATLSKQEKLKYSHRGKAIQNFITQFGKAQSQI
jgi:XTP/dITP diphosphohydrolase